MARTDDLELIFLESDDPLDERASFAVSPSAGSVGVDCCSDMLRLLVEVLSPLVGVWLREGALARRLRPLGVAATSSSSSTISGLMRALDGVFLAVVARGVASEVFVTEAARLVLEAGLGGCSSSCITSSTGTDSAFLARDARVLEAGRGSS